MLYFLLFLFELFLLFLLSRSLTRAISFLLYHLTKSKKIAVHGLAFLFFPGTVIHELSHALTAALLGVHVGQMEFLPVIDGDKVKMGSVQIAKTDFFRRFLIGTAPFFSGTGIVLGILSFAAHNHLFENVPMLLVIGYCIFEIGNTMFSSRKDMEGTLELLITIMVVIGVFYFFGLWQPWMNPNVFFEQNLVTVILQKGCLFLLVPIALDVTVIGLLKFVKR